MSGGQKGQKGGGSGAGRTESDQKALQAANSEMSKGGCGCLVAIFLVVFVVPFLWGLYDEGVFDRKDPGIESAPVFGPRETGQLVERLATASRAQGVCYGWVIESGRYRAIPTVTPSYSGTFRPESTRPSPTVPRTGASPETTPRTGVSPAPRRTPETGTAQPTRRPGTVPSPSKTLTPSERREIDRALMQLQVSGVEYGSNLGVGVDPRRHLDRCPRWAVLTADYSYSSSDQEWTSGTMEIETSRDLDLETTNRFELEAQVSQQKQDDILGTNSIARLSDVIGSMPMLVAQEGLAAPVPAASPAPAAQAAPAADRLDEPLNLGRTIFIGIGIALIAGGVVWIAVAAVRNRRGTSS
ncbi:hypothetical protein [Actinomadura rugatobispora]|uniref:DUF3068 domain-containing protein n=1 Tax=Actinomadura rugatobispora TaxID=1994 RepID=A0ABW1A896_9ACTN|nr:hypothetical protein GCM10010200_062340 [Actinomadura rugatobispora]